MQSTAVNKQPSDVKKIIIITLKLLVISVICSLLLAVVNELTKDKIADNTKREKEAAISELFPGSFDVSVFDGSFEGINEVNTIYSGNDMYGYVAEVAPNGFGGAITLMVGVDSDGEVVGVKLISHSETAGLGSRVGDAEYLVKYRGATSDTVVTVDTISGATISSTAVREGVKKALSIFADVTANGGTAQ